MTKNPKPHYSSFFSKKTNATEKLDVAKKDTSSPISLDNLGFTKKVIAKSDAELRRNEKTFAIGKNLSSPVEFFEMQPVKNIIDDVKITLDPSQERALEGILNNTVACIIGAAGTGKTTLLKQVIAQLADKVNNIDINGFWDRNKILNNKEISEYAHAPKYVPSIAFCAPTGRGTEQMKRFLDIEYHKNCSTVHSLLGYYPEIEWSEKHQKEIKHWVPAFSKNNKLPFTGYVFDEAGMFWLRLWNEFMDAYKEKDNSFILLMGDINQLQPPMDKSILGFGMLNFPTFELTQIHRQAADNPIIANSHRVLKGEMPVATPGKFDIISPINIPSNPSKAFNFFIQLIPPINGGAF